MCFCYLQTRMSMQSLTHWVSTWAPQQGSEPSQFKAYSFARPAEAGVAGSLC